ncbi:putative uncharacterized protein [Eubacterium sp. CAG:252]|nr:putative uncharacterized protein [Eubacterium sp. CAG:252]
MADYQRFVSYIYSYPGGVKDKNVGFAKVEVRSGEMRLNINLRGVYTDTPQMFGVHMLIDRDDAIPGRYRLMKVGDCLVNNGMASYAGIFNAGNIENSGYTSSDICGIAVANKGDRYYMMFSMWEDYDINPDVIEFAGSGVSKYGGNVEIEGESEDDIDSSGSGEIRGLGKGYTEGSEGNKEDDVGGQDNRVSDGENGEVRYAEGGEGNKNGNVVNYASGSQCNKGNYDKRSGEDSYVAEREDDWNGGTRNRGKENTPDIHMQNRYNEELQAMESEEDDTESCGCPNKDKVNEKTRQDACNERLYKKLYSKADYVDAFDDDYFYDCIEVTPQMLSRLPLKDKEIINNSFLIHGYYNFHHLLFGRVCDNENNTNYFIGVPGMYCNRERYMASMFGFSNFKKSHRSDYNNPYFGYWYQEI